MKDLLYIFNKRLTLGFILSIIITFIITAGIRFLYENFFDITPIKGGLNEIDLYFYASIVIVRFIIAALLEYLMGDTHAIPAGFSEINNVPLQSEKIALKMDDNKASSSKNLDNKGKTSSKGLPNADTSPSISKMLNVDEIYALRKEFTDNLVTQREMIKKLAELKSANDLTYYLDKDGALDLGVPRNISDKDIQDIAKKVGIIDRIINTKFAEYGKLEGKDLMSNDSILSNSYLKLKKSVKEQYDQLFDKD